MQDRVPAPGKENRVRIRLDDGQSIEGVLEYADEPSVQGSAYNKANVLPDDVCTALGVPTSAEPKDAFNSIVESFNRVQSTIDNIFVFGSYTGNQDFRTDTARKINIGFNPRAVFIIAGDTSIVDKSGFIYSAFSFTGSGGVKTGVDITTNGFNVYNSSESNAQLNYKENTYYYWAVR